MRRREGSARLPKKWQPQQLCPFTVSTATFFHVFQLESRPSSWVSEVKTPARTSPITLPWIKPEFTPSEITTSLQEGRKSPPNSSTLFKNLGFPLWFSQKDMLLDELVHVMHCRKTIAHTVYPIFYDVDPSDVWKQSGTFAEAFARHEERFAAEMERVHKWRGALTEAANLSGWDLQSLENGYDILRYRLFPCASFSAYFCSTNVSAAWLLKSNSRSYGSLISRLLVRSDPNGGIVRITSPPRSTRSKFLIYLWSIVWKHLFLFSFF